MFASRGSLGLSVVIALACVSASAWAAVPIKLSYQSWTSDPAHEAAIKRFEELNPDIDIDLRVQGGGPYGYAEKMIVSAAGGITPDILRANHESAPLLAVSRLLLPLDGLLKSARVSSEAWFKPNFDMFNYDNKQLALPMHVGNGGALFFNATVFAESGLPSLLSVAYGGKWNRETYADIARKLTRDTNADGRPEQWGIGDVPGWYWMMYVRQSGGRVFTPDGRRCTLDSPEAIDGLAFMYRLRHVHKVWNPGADWLAITDRRNAMQITAGWAVQYCQKAKVDWNIVPLFAGKVDGWQNASGDGIGIGVRTRHKAAAWRFIRFMAGEEGSRIQAMGGAITPALKKVAGSSEWQGMYPGKNLKALLETSDVRVIEPRALKQQKRINAIFGEYLERFYAGKASPEATGAALAQALNRILR